MEPDRAAPDAVGGVRGPVGHKSGRKARREGLRARLEALLELLGDDSPQVRSVVTGELRRLGRQARPALERTVRTGSARLRARARQLLLEEQRQQAVRRLVRYSTRSAIELEPALFLLDQFSAPGEDKRAHRSVLDSMGDELRKRLRGVQPGLDRPLAMVEYLAGELQFGGPEEDYHHPDHIQLGRTLETHQGLPLTLCAVYSFVARRAGLEAGLMPFPGHVLLRVSDAGQRTIIDPFSGGRVLTESHCLNYLANHGLPYRAEWFRPAEERSMFLRQVLNLMRSLEGLGRLADRRALVPVFRTLAGPEAPVPELVPQSER